MKSLCETCGTIARCLVKTLGKVCSCPDYLFQQDTEIATKVVSRAVSRSLGEKAGLSMPKPKKGLK